MLRRDGVRSLVQEHGGPEGYLKWQAAALAGEITLPTGRKGKVPVSEFSIRALWEGLVGPVEETLPSYASSGMGFVEVQEAVTSSAFPSATGQLIAQKVIEGYEAAPGIGDQLVTVYPSKLRNERLVGFTALQGPKTVGEGQEYEDSTFEDKYVTTIEAKKGRLLSITEEAVYFDQTGQVLMRAGMLGDATRQERERVIIRGVADVASTERIWRPNGSAAQLYSSTYTNYLATATPLVDWTDIQETLTYHATNMVDDRATDDTLGPQPIAWVPKIILTSVAKAGVAANIINATQVWSAPGASTPSMVSGNVLNTLLPGGIRALSSPFLDQAAAASADQYGDANDWFLGDFARQFVWKEIWPLQVLRYTLDEAQARRDLVATFKVRYYGGLNAIDHKYVVKVNDT